MNKKSIPRMCITCQHSVEHFRCAKKDCYVGCTYDFEVNTCNQWELHDDYKNSGKFHEGHKVNGYDVETVITSARKLIQKADNMPQIRKPISYALFKLWRAFDFVEKERKSEDG